MSRKGGGGGGGGGGGKGMFHLENKMNWLTK